MRLLFDTNVVLDVLLDRRPFVQPAAALFAMIEQGAVEGLLGSTSVTTVHYIAEKSVGRAVAREHLRTLLSLFGIAEVAKSTLLEALDSAFVDFEDAVLHQAGVDADVDGIVTRDEDGFEKSLLPIFSPSELLAALRAPKSEL